MESIALLFPGQGSQSVGMLAAFADSHPVVLQVFSQASDKLGYDLWDLCQNGPQDKLSITQYTQPAMFVASVACYRVWQELALPQPKFMAGHSLGEYSALVCAGALSFLDGLELVNIRAQAMQSAVAADSGAMAAIIGLSDTEVTQICDKVSKNIAYVVPANFNSPGQVVISGLRAGVIGAVDEAKSCGARRSVVLPVSVPSHCQLMEPAVAVMQQALQKITWNKTNIKVIHNFNAGLALTENIVELLLKQLIAPVRWTESMQYLASQNIVTAFECGPGKVLQGLVKRMSIPLQVKSVHDESIVDYFQEQLS